MWTGPLALKNIDGTLQTIRNDVIRIDSQISSLSSTLAAQQRQRAKVLSDIAAVRLVEIEQGALRAELSLADREAQAILEQRETALQSLVAGIEISEAEIVESERQRNDLLALVNITSEKIVTAESKVQAELKVNSRYVALLDATRLAESVATEAEQKVNDAKQDMAKKAEPYQADALFLYLWQRHYGTTEYSAGFVARYFDSKVARLIDYEQARINYWNLTEIPKRLQQHADLVSEQADDQVMALQQLELEALTAANVDNLESELASMRKQLDNHDDLLEADEEKLQHKLQERAAFLSGEDDFIKRCLSTLSAAIEHQSMRSVRRYVQVTHSPTDDQLVVELQNLEEQFDSVNDNIASLRQLHVNQLSRLREIEEVRRNFKNSRFDDIRSGFNNESLISGVLTQFVQGLVSGSDVWRVIKRSQQYRDMGSVPDFGSGGLGNIGDILRDSGRGQRGRRSRQSSWSWPKPRRGGGGFNFPRSSGGSSTSGGGFRTGGGF